MSRASVYVKYKLGGAETSPGIYEETEESRRCSAYIEQVALRHSSDSVNPSISSSTRVRITAGEFEKLNYMNIRAVKWAGVWWTVQSVQYIRPRLLIYLGGVDASEEG